jgi:hypothetical protein
MAFERITINPNQMGGLPSMRELRDPLQHRVRPPRRRQDS